MKKFIIILCLLSFQILNAQPDDITCGMPDDNGYTWGLREVEGSIQRGGLYETSIGTLKVLVVFARIKNDNSSNNDWPAGQDYPLSDTYIDEDIYVQGTNQINLTNYFNQMSLGTFHVIGEAINVETMYERNHYANYYQATKEILQNQVDQQINYSQYDTWTPVLPPGNHINSPDGIIDMIMVVWRGQPFLPNIGGIANLGGGTSYTVESGTKTVNPNFALTGSGVTVQNVGSKWPLYNFHSSVHEMGHYLIGSSHPYNPNVDEHGLWGILRHGQDGICANTFERELLAWINPNEITGDILNAPFNDFITTGSAYKYKPANGGTYEYYYFENHQKLSIYDNATVNGNDNGIFVVHQNYIYNSETNSIRVKTSDGDWNWQNLTGTTSCFGSPVAIIKWKKTTVNRAGKNHRDQIYVNNNWSWIWWIEGFGCGGYPYGEILNET